MRFTLAQTLPTTQSILPHSQAVDYLNDWSRTLRQSPHALLPALSLAAGILVAGLFLSLIFGRFLKRWGVRTSTHILVITTSIYAGLWMLAPEKMDDPADHISLWLHRVFAAVVLIILVRLFDRFLLRPTLTRGGRIPINRFLHQLVLFIIFIYVFLGYLSASFGFSADRILAGSAVLTIVVGLALQDSLGNLFAGVVLQASNPFAIGDWVEIGTDEGRVVDMTWRAVTILNGSNNHVLVPNSVLTKQRIVNYHAPTLASGYSVTIDLDPAVPPEQVIGVLEEALRDTSGVMRNPSPGANIKCFDASAIKYQAYFSVADPSDHWGVESRLRLNIWYRLRAAGIRIPYPARTIEMLDTKAQAQAREKAELAERFDAISRTELFKPMSEAQRLQLAQESRQLLLAPAQTLYRKGDRGSTLYIIARGTMDVLVDREDDGEEFALSMSAPEFFGELTAMTGDTRAVTVRSHDESVLVEINCKNLEDVFKNDPAMMQKIVSVLDERRTAGYAKLAEFEKKHRKTQITSTEAEQSLFDRVRGFFAGL